MTLADVELNIKEGAKPALTAYVNKLMANPKFFRQMVDRADAYLPMVERVFQEEGLPIDFRYSVIQESSLVSYLVSSSNAVGYWQFKKETATEMGLRVDHEIDERMNIISSSRSAAKYLIRHNQYMQNWVYSLLAYYAGLSGAKGLINSELIGTKTMDIDENTHWYILKFLAHKIAFEPHLYRNTSSPNLRVMEYTECENKSLDQLAQETNYPVEQLQFYNRWILNGFVPGDKDYTLILPLKAEDGTVFEAPLYVKASPPVEKLEPWRERYFFGLIEKPVTQPEPVVLANGKTEIPVFFDWNGIKAIQAKEDDSPAKLALLAGISRDEFLEYNDLRVFDPLVSGEVYYVDNKKNKSKIPFHTVQHGESLWEVAQKYGLKLKSLMAKNRMPRPEKLKPGRVLWLRHTRPEDEAIKYEPVTELPKQEIKNVDVMAKTIATPTPQIAKAEPKPVDLKKIEADAKLILGQDSLKPESTETLREVAETNNVEIEIVPEEPKPVFSPVPKKQEIEVVATASTKSIPAEPAKPVLIPQEVAPVVKTAIMPNAQNGMIEVGPGMTWYQISRYYKKPLDSLFAWNLGISRELKIGQKIRVEKEKQSFDLNAVQPVSNRVSNPQVSVLYDSYEVKQGDTAYKIAQKFGIKVDQLLQINQREDAALRVGELVKIPKQ
jgi:membrane-bound lytic murein transglycosylase D